MSTSASTARTAAGRYVIITCHTPAGLYGNLTDWSSVRGGTWGGFGGFRYYYEEER